MVNECVICRHEKETTLATVRVYREEGQATPFLKIEVCETCLNGEQEDSGISDKAWHENNRIFWEGRGF